MTMPIRIRATGTPTDGPAQLAAEMIRLAVADLHSSSDTRRASAARWVRGAPAALPFAIACAQVGLEPEYVARRIAGTDSEAKTYHTYTDEDRRRVVDLRALGYSWREIAGELRSSPGSIKRLLAREAAR